MAICCEATIPSCLVVASDIDAGDQPGTQVPVVVLHEGMKEVH